MSEAKEQKLSARPADRRLPEKLSSPGRRPGLVNRMLVRFFWRLLRLYLKVYHRLEIRGLDHLPSRPPFIICANHSSHLDALVLGSALPAAWQANIFPIAAGRRFFNRPRRILLASLFINALPIWRDHANKHTLDAFRNRLLEDQAILIYFPEGERTRTGEFLPFHSGIGEIVNETDVPIIPCFIQGAFEACSPLDHFPRPRKIILHVGKPLRADKTARDHEGADATAAALEGAIRRLRDEAIS